MLSQADQIFFLQNTQLPQAMVNGTTTRSPRFRLVTSLPDFLNDPHEFVAKNVARFHGGDEAVEQMQIRSADRGARDFDNGVMRIQQLSGPSTCATFQPCCFPSNKLLS